MKNNSKLNTEAKVAILQAFASFKSLGEIQLLLHNDFDVDVSLQNISEYRKRYKDEIADMRMFYLLNVAEQKSFHRRWRMQQREKMLNRILVLNDPQYFTVADRLLNSLKDEAYHIGYPGSLDEFGLISFEDYIGRFHGRKTKDTAA